MYNVRVYRGNRRRLMKSLMAVSRSMNMRDDAWLGFPDQKILTPDDRVALDLIVSSINSRINNVRPR